MTSMQARSASRSAVPRLTGKPPSTDRNHPPGLDAHSDSLPMYRSRRRVMAATMGVSRFERWMGDTMKAPSRGTLWLPTTSARK